MNKKKIALGCLGAFVAACLGMAVLGALVGEQPEPQADDRVAAESVANESEPVPREHPSPPEPEPQEEPADEAEPQAHAEEERIEESDDGEWYEGGTLHRAKITEWRKATAANRLATCADFVSSAMEKQGRTPRNMVHLLELATDLRTCVDESVREGHADTQDASTIAAMCYLMMDL